MQKQKIYIIIAVVFALLAVIMTKVYLGEQQKSIYAAAQMAAKKRQQDSTSVLVAKADIPRGAIVDQGKLEVSIIPNDYVVPQAVTSLDRIAGMFTIASIQKGEQISLSKLAYPKQRGGLTENTPVGKRAITVAVDNVSSLAGMIKAGDYVDVIALMSIPVQTADGKMSAQAAVIPLFQNVLILAVGQETGGPAAEQQARYAKEEKKEISSGLITLALSPQEASIIAFVQEQGKLRLVARNSADSKIEPFQPVSWEALLQYFSPKTAPKEEKPIVKEETYVDIYRGVNKERVPLAK